jgi:hypothetical protein
MWIPDCIESWLADGGRSASRTGCAVLPRYIFFYFCLRYAIRSVRRLLVTANVPSSPIIVTLMLKALNSSETTVLTRATWRNFPEDAIHHSHPSENLKFWEVVQ